MNSNYYFLTNLIFDYYSCPFSLTTYIYQFICVNTNLILYFRARAVGIHGDKSQSERDHVLKRKSIFTIALIDCQFIFYYF